MVAFIMYTNSTHHIQRWHSVLLRAVATLPSGSPHRHSHCHCWCPLPNPQTPHRTQDTAPRECTLRAKYNTCNSRYNSERKGKIQCMHKKESSIETVQHNSSTNTRTVSCMLLTSGAIHGGAVFEEQLQRAQSKHERKLAGFSVAVKVAVGETDLV